MLTRTFIFYTSVSLGTFNLIGEEDLKATGLPIIRRVLPYAYQMLTYENAEMSRHITVKQYNHISRLRQVMFRYNDITASIPHMIYFSTRFRFINVSRIGFFWSKLGGPKSRRWRRKFGDLRKRMYARILLTAQQFYNFWLMFISIFMARRLYTPFKRRVGSGTSLFHWFGRFELFWEFPAVPNIFFFNAKSRSERGSFYLRIIVSRKKRPSFMIDRDMFRALNFPIFFYTVPRMWQPDPTRYVCYLRYWIKKRRLAGLVEF
jgi:hypothetical protein